jgi:capsid protein
MENGSISYIGQDDEIAQVQAVQPMQQTPDFIRAMLRLIGLPMDMPLELVLMDFSEPNFAAAKANLLGFYRAMTPKQNNFKTRALSRGYRWWLSREVNNNSFTNAPPTDFWAHEFLAHEWTWVDPIEQMQAALLEMDAGLNSRPRIAKKLGRDPDELHEEQKADMERRKKDKLPLLHSSLTRDPTPEPPKEPPNADPKPRTPKR